MTRRTVSRSADITIERTGGEGVKKPRSESRQLTELVGVRLTEDEMTAVQWLAARAGVKVPTWFRRQLLDAVSRMGPPFHYRSDAERVAGFLTARVKPNVVSVRADTAAGGKGGTDG